jgi:hypothetical protein
MDKVSVDLQHCYGIKALKHDFNFLPNCKAYAIYAPNGAMKSSFAHTFKDLANAASGAAPRDRIFPDRLTVAKVTDQNELPIQNERVYVIESYDDQVCPDEKHSALLVDTKLREQYESIQAKVRDSEKALLTAIMSQSKSKIDLQIAISLALTPVPNDFRRALARVRDEVREQSDAPFSNVEWDRIFSEPIQNLLNTKNLKDRIADYIARYDELLENSAFFKKGLFDHYNADQIAKNLSNNGFFKADHTVSLRSLDKIVEIKDESELKKIIEDERKFIVDDDKLVSLLGEVQKQLDKNQETREFRSYLMDNMYILPHLSNINKFREDVVKSYLKSNEDVYLSLLSVYEEVKGQEAEIFEAAANQRTQWQEVIDIFNRRFAVPFKLNVDNHVDVVAGKDKIMKLGFVYEDGQDKRLISRSDLIEYLSNGEKKAFYILQVIFEIERRIKENIETLIIVDDLAYAFDYQNKYAIVEYLMDIGEVDVFKQIVLTHNFDFLRTLQGRLVNYAACLIALKKDTGIELEPVDGIKNIFANKWKPGFFTNSLMKIGSIAFLRNLVENSRGENDPTYLKLTQMLHWRPETAALKVKDLDEIFCKETNSDHSSENVELPIIDLIDEAADEAFAAGPGFNLENKVVLAIATRLRAERFMVAKINNNDFWYEIRSNQTWNLFSKFKKMDHCDEGTKDTLDRVLLMTPENIHLNSFMYEPLVDMNEDRLKRLYQEVKALT